MPRVSCMCRRAETLTCRQHKQTSEETKLRYRDSRHAEICDKIEKLEKEYFRSLKKKPWSTAHRSKGMPEISSPTLNTLTT